jgi:hypothetical protein
MLTGSGADEKREQALKWRELIVKSHFEPPSTDIFFTLLHPVLQGLGNHSTTSIRGNIEAVEPSSFNKFIVEKFTHQLSAPIPRTAAALLIE